MHACKIRQALFFKFTSLEFAVYLDIDVSLHLVFAKKND